MTKIAFIAPDIQMLDAAQRAALCYGDQFHFEHGLLSKGAAAAKRLAEQGVEIFISRGGTAEAIRECLPHCTVIPVLISGFDLVRACVVARSYGKRIGMVAFPFMIQGVDCLNELTDAAITLFPLDAEENAEVKILEAKASGVDVVAGGIVTDLVAKKLGFPSVVIESGPEAVGKAVHEAARVAQVMSQERASSSLYRALITHVDNGIITVDREARITVINPAAARMARVAAEDAAGALVAEVWPELSLEQTLADGQEDLGVIIKTFGRDIICNKIPLKVSGKTVGAVATCHDVRSIQKMEASVRSKAVTTGHRAKTRFADIMGGSAAVHRTVRLAANYAKSDATVLILGETGTGKELFAQSIHNHGTRATAPFVAVNCAALPEQLLESELFGYARGAFTSANPKGKAGLLELAHGGTVFLDEIAELELSTQGKILRVLQEKQVMRLGDDLLLPVNVRVIAATNKNLRALVEAGAFRADLYYRINVLRLDLPPLRERPQDIPELARHLLQEALGHHARAPKLSQGAIAVLRRRSWPGNIRELQNIMERIAATITSPLVTESAICELLTDSCPGQGMPESSAAGKELQEALAQAKGRMGKAASLLGISRETLWRRRRRLGL